MVNIAANAQNKTHKASKRKFPMTTKAAVVQVRSAAEGPSFLGQRRVSTANACLPGHGSHGCRRRDAALSGAVDSDSVYMSSKNGSLKQINSISEANRRFDSGNSCKRLGPSRVYELHDSTLPFVWLIEFIHPLNYPLICSYKRDRCLPPRHVAARLTRYDTTHTRPARIIPRGEEPAGDSTPSRQAGTDRGRLD